MIENLNIRYNLIHRKAVLSKSRNCSNPFYMSVESVTIDFILKAYNKELKLETYFFGSK